jgi:hypothetical protein
MGKEELPEVLAKKLENKIYLRTDDIRDIYSCGKCSAQKIIYEVRNMFPKQQLLPKGKVSVPQFLQYYNGGK